MDEGGGGGRKRNLMSYVQMLNFMFWNQFKTEIRNGIRNSNNMERGDAVCGAGKWLAAMTFRAPCRMRTLPIRLNLQLEIEGRRLDIVRRAAGSWGCLAPLPWGERRRAEIVEQKSVAAYKLRPACRSSCSRKRMLARESVQRTSALLQSSVLLAAPFLRRGALRFLLHFLLLLLRHSRTILETTRNAMRNSRPRASCVLLC